MGGITVISENVHIYGYMYEVEENNTYFILLLVGVLGFSVGVAFFFAPIIMAQSYTLTLSLLIGIGVVYGYFTAIYIHGVDSIHRDHHAGIWATVILGTMAGFFVMQERLIAAGYALWLPTSQTVFLLGICFSLTYLMSYISFLLHWEDGLA